MKKALIIAPLAALSLTSCSLLGGMAGTGGSMASSVVGALANENTLNNLLSSFLGGVAINEQTLYGTWTYQGVDVAFESENFLAKAGGAVAAGTVETKIEEQLQKYGIKPGVARFTFNQDKTFTANLGGKNVSGTYTYDPATRQLTLSAAFGLFNQTATVGTSGRGISLLFPADKLLSLVSTASSLLGQSSGTLSTLSSLVGNYKGMQIGLELSK